MALATQLMAALGDSVKVEEVKILRDNMPFGRPVGNYDRLLDFSTAVTGGLFFVPSADLLEALADRQPGA